MPHYFLLEDGSSNLLLEEEISVLLLEGQAVAGEFGELVGGDVVADINSDPRRQGGKIVMTGKASFQTLQNTLETHSQNAINSLTNRFDDTEYYAGD